MAIGSSVPVSVALSPSDADAVPQLLQEITQGVDKWQSLQKSGGDSLQIDEARHELLIKTRSMMQALETPRETMIKHCWAQGGVATALTCGVDKGLWTLMAKNGDRPQTVAELSKALDWDPALLSRLLRHLAAMGYLHETALDEYRPTNFIKALSIPIIGDGYMPTLVVGGAGALEFVEYAKRTGYRNPVDASDTSIMQAQRTTLDFFALNEAHGYGPHFNNHMGGYRQGRLPWMHPQFFPVQEKLIDGAEADGAFLVDVGGNVGHDLELFRQYYPDHPGKLILQDSALVLGQISKLDAAIERMDIDFFVEQPVKGARAYYMHSVLHDWPDDKCSVILSRLTAAMKKGYSKLLVNENVIPSTGAWWESTALDLAMMNLFCSKERTYEEWKSLLESNGLRIVSISTVGRGVESLIECELA